MTEVVFHFNVADKENYIFRLLRKAFATGARVVVTGPEQKLSELNAALWMMSPTDFLPHCCSSDGAGMIKKSPIVLSPIVIAGQLTDETLLNLSEVVPHGCEQFSRLIEVVTLNDEDRQSARQRWKRYADMGMSLLRHEVKDIVK